MKNCIMALLWVALGAASVHCSCAALAHELRFYLPAAKLPPESPTERLRLSTGQEVAVATPPIARVGRESVVGARGALIPVAVEPGAERWLGEPKVYRVVFKLTQHAQRALQEGIDRYCGTGTDVQIAVANTIVDHVVLLGCGGVFEAGASFVDEQAAQKFAQEFAGKSVNFSSATPSPR